MPCTIGIFSFDQYFNYFLSFCLIYQLYLIAHLVVAFLVIFGYLLKLVKCHHPHHPGWCKLFRVWVKFATEHKVFCCKEENYKQKIHPLFFNEKNNIKFQTVSESREGVLKVVRA